MKAEGGYECVGIWSANRPGAFVVSFVSAFDANCEGATFLFSSPCCASTDPVLERLLTDCPFLPVSYFPMHARLEFELDWRSLPALTDRPSSDLTRPAYFPSDHCLCLTSFSLPLPSLPILTRPDLSSSELIGAEPDMMTRPC